MAPFNRKNTEAANSSKKKTTNAPKKYLFKYSEDALRKTLQDIREKGMGIREACRLYGVPRTTVQDRLSSRVLEKPRKIGPDPVLGVDGENKITDWVIQMAQCGFPIKKDDLLKTVASIVLDSGKKTPFKDGKPGQKWYQKYLKRHPEISLREAETINKARAAITEEGIRHWFKTLKEYLEQKGAEDILEDPERILNGDETGISLCPKTGKVLAPKGYKNLFEIKSNKEKENITVLVMFNATGKICPPLVVLPYVRPPKAVVDNMPKSWVLGRSDSGWMKGDVFYEYVANEFNKWLGGNNIKKPCLLLIDGHKSHMTMPLSEFCEANGIILYALPPNTTHLLQPADVSVFKPLKQEWKKTVSNWQEKQENMNSVITKTNFCKVFKETMNLDMTTAIINGFRKCGLFPFNPDAVDYSKCVKNTLRKATRKSDGNVTGKDFEIAIKVIASIRDNLTKHGIDANIIFQEIEAAKSNLTPRRGHVNMTMTTPAAYVPCIQDVNSTLSLPEIGSFVSLNDISLIPLTDISTMDDDLNCQQSFENIQNEPFQNTSVDVDVNTTIAVADVHAEPESHAPNKLQSQLEYHKFTNNLDPSIHNSPELDIIEESLKFPDISGMIRPISISSQVPIVHVQLNETIIFPDVHTEIENQDPNKQPEYQNVVTKNTLIDNPPETDPFEKHLKFPELRPDNESKKRSVKLPSAISSEAWRIHHQLKEEEKEKKAKEINERKKIRAKSKADRDIILKEKKLLKIKNIKQKTEKKDKSEMQIKKPKQKCTSCNDDLVSDVEDDNDKNIGCDNCVRWYHLKCTSLRELPYLEAASKDYECELCEIAKIARNDVLDSYF